MKAVQVRATGGREALALCELSDPAPGKDEVLVQVRTSGVNFIDDGHFYQGVRETVSVE
jgi:NADPH:quinone reductase